MSRVASTKLTGPQEKFVRMEARGEGRPAILREVFGLDVNTSPANEIHNADAKMSRWRQHPCYDECWKSEVKRYMYGATGGAIRRIRNQIDCDNDWLANKAANDILLFGKSQIYGDEEKSISVQITGMPELGTPDSDGGSGEDT